MAELPVVVLLDVVAWRYAVGVRRAWATAGPRRLIRPAEVSRFMLGLIAVAAALVSPLDGHATTSLTAHMVQHILLLTVAPPLLVLGAPIPALLWSLPTRWRSTGRAGWRRVVSSRRGTGWVWWMATALVVQTATMWIWHIPTLYVAAVHHDGLHIAEHATYLATGCLFWWAVTAGPHRHHGGGAIAVLVGALPGTVLGAVLTLASRPLYRPAYPSLADQQMAGVLMWAFAGAAYVIAAGVLVGLWIRGLDRADQRPVFAAPTGNRPVRPSPNLPVRPPLSNQGEAR